MRVIVAVVLGLVVLIGGFWAISTQAQQTGDYLDGTTGTEGDVAYNVTADVTEGVASVTAIALPWAGIAAVVVLAAGVLAAAFRGGGR